MSHENPERPWGEVAADLFTNKNREYPSSDRYNSNFWELDRLFDTKSSTVIKKLKAHLARYDIPKQFVSDSGPGDSIRMKRLSLFRNNVTKLR